MSIGRSALMGLAVAASGGVAQAQHFRAHGALEVAKAVGGFQETELSFGGAGLVAVEMPVTPQIGAELEVGTVFLSSGADPTDVTLKPMGGSSAIYGALGVRVRPFAKKDPTHITALTGIWAAGDFGATTTGGLFRAVADLQAGYDFSVEQGRYGIGPAFGLVHVFQPDSELRPDDANIVVFGAHAVFDSAPRVPGKVIDKLDRCPDEPEDMDGFEDADGCPDPDNDQDGILDAADHCPMDPEDKDGFEDTDGCPDPDNDKDGIADPKDKCPNDAEDVDGFEDEDGCPDPDNDKDGIPDKEDLCPNEPETKNGYADEDGCPDEDQVRVVGEKIVLDDRVHFEQNNAIIRPVSFPLLERLSKLLREHPEYMHIEVQGHTDQKGSADFNKKLSRDRAESVAVFLSKHGVESTRLSAVGFGSAHLLVEKDTERALFLNRRVEFVITRQVSVSGSTAPRPPPAAAPGASAPDGQNEKLEPPRAGSQPEEP
jgi:outer membrane protein OmpA-like peptidoglycan-associated protein